MSMTWGGQSARPARTWIVDQAEDLAELERRLNYLDEQPFAPGGVGFAGCGLRLLTRPDYRERSLIGIQKTEPEIAEAHSPRFRFASATSAAFKTSNTVPPAFVRTACDTLRHVVLSLAAARNS